LKAARIIAPNEPLQVLEIEIPKPEENQVVVKVKAVGVCHSDLHLWAGGYDTGDGFMKVTDRGVKFPVTPGHEVVGSVSEIGSSVKGVSIGDEVLVYPWIGCGECSTCNFHKTITSIITTFPQMQITMTNSYCFYFNNNLIFFWFWNFNF